ncbi:30S ribosomal protein S9 [candidate division MSBL1 archaeon SCGC-AAA259I09]|uniref:Small ribosomal subunit protein uS9 n=2 Tax=candidate division MSBL1 TaxID=215777 RepID=A0A133UTD8_9EURY|nr:30S ribosomal protein S9 [candidate division MSBL1 archaeon SCGC-AAA259I09]KXA98798.1 30S ribosomal protein S9 [candidate division MSBL1 archaeon SCGC-AAA259J03]
MKTVQTTGKRKTAVARATVKKGSGNIYINNRALDTFEPELARLKIKEPIRLAGDVTEEIDIEVNVSGGGYMGQADASRTAIAKGLIEWTEDEELYKKFKEYDESLTKSDMRRKESKKPGGRGARKKRQKSYR